MESASKSELSALYITANTMVPICNTLIEMVWSKPKSTIQTENSTVVGFTNNNIINKAIKSLDMKLWWLQDRKLQGQFRYYWEPVPKN